MKRVILEVDNIPHSIEVLGVERLDQNRTAVKVRSAAKLDRGRSCIIRAEEGQELACVVSNVTSVKDSYLIEVRCLEDAEFLLLRAGDSAAGS